MEPSAAGAGLWLRSLRAVDDGVRPRAEDDVVEVGVARMPDEGSSSSAVSGECPDRSAPVVWMTAAVLVVITSARVAPDGSGGVSTP